MPIQQYLIRIYQFAIGISGIVAVGMITTGGILISVSESIDKKGKGKEMIRDSFFGIVLLFGSYLLLRTINPDIVALQEPGRGDAAPVTQIDDGEPTTPEVSSECAAPTAIPINGAIGATEPNGGGACRYKRARTVGGGVISSNEYYDTSIGFPAGTLLWFYPYYLASTGGSSAQCLIYAKKEPAGSATDCTTEAGCVPTGGDPSVTMIPLKLDSLRKCSVGPTEEGAPLSVGADVNSINTSRLATNGSCNPSLGTSPSGIIADIKNGLTPRICYPGCTASSAECPRSGATISAGTISIINKFQELGIGFTVTSLTGGSHSAAGDPHYTGKALDVVISENNATAWNNALSQIRSSGLTSTAMCEYVKDGVSKYVSSCDDAFSGSISNLHLHIQAK
jgi:hypothetical protein